MSESAQVFRRALAAIKFRGVQLLDALKHRDECLLYCPSSVSSQELATSLNVKSELISNILGAPWIRLPEVPMDLTALAESEPALLAGRNVTIATRNGEPIETVLEWLTFHFNHFGMNGVVLFHRSPDQDIHELCNAIEGLKLPLAVVVVVSELPLGSADKPEEAHPWCVSEAPGRRRMEIPPADPKRAPLAEVSIFEIARWRFLTEARAIANIDLCDMLFAPTKDLLSGKPFTTPFDMAADNPNEAVGLLGQHCYPWRVRKGKMPRFGDHTCVQFDRPVIRQRWCVAGKQLGSENVLKFRLVRKKPICQTAKFYRYMAIRHPTENPHQIVPKSSLIEEAELAESARRILQHNPVRVPKASLNTKAATGRDTTIVTTMKNEGPFILEWLAHHQAVGVRNFLIYTNDCDDGTDQMLDLLQTKGIVEHRTNPFRQVDMKPQHAALQASEKEPVVRAADWLICMDVDEFLNIKVGDGTLDALFDAVGDANLISCTWRLFGNADVHHFDDSCTLSTFDRCAHEFTPKPHQAWGFKTLYRNNGIFRKMGVHRPKGLRPQLWEEISWVNGSGKPMPRKEFRNAWRSTKSTYGYDLVALNHYAVRNAESFLVKRDRGRVNHVDRDQGLGYWFRMNNNAVEERSIQRRIPMMQKKLVELMDDPEIAAMHHACVAAHRKKIDQLLGRADMALFFKELTSTRMEQLSRMHQHFGANVFLSGPNCVPDEIVHPNHPDDFFFTVPRARATQA